MTRHGEMGTKCAVCEVRAAEVRASDGRLMCEPCRRTKGAKVVARLPASSTATRQS